MLTTENTEGTEVLHKALTEAVIGTAICVHNVRPVRPKDVFGGTLRQLRGDAYAPETGAVGRRNPLNYQLSTINRYTL